MSVYKIKGIIQILFPMLVFCYFYFYDLNLTLLISSLIFSFLVVNFLTAIMHRAFAHKISPIKNKFIAFLLGYFTTVYFTTSPRDWCGIHYLHHRYSDTEKDPHTTMQSWLFLRHDLKEIDSNDLLKMSLFYRHLFTRKEIAFFSEYFLPVLFFNFGLFYLIGIEALIFFYVIPVIYTHLGEMISIQNHNGSLGGISTSDKHNGRNGYFLSMLVPTEMNHSDHHDRPTGDDFSNRMIRKLFQ